MPIYLLGSRTASVEIDRQAVSVSIGSSVDGVGLYVDVAGHRNVVRVNPHAVILPAITEKVTVCVAPEGSAAFAHDTIVYLTIGSSSPGEVDPVQVAFDAVNVSGSGATELAALTPRGGRVEVRVRAVPDAPLSPLASMARTAARRGGGRHLRPGHGSLSIGVDTSASMRWAFDDGSVSAAIDVVVGVADVAGIRDITAALVGACCSPVSAPVAELAHAVAEASVRWSAGARWSLLPETAPAVAITDSVNPVGGGRFTAVCVSHDGALPASCPVLATPPQGTTAQRHLAANPAMLDELAAALLPALV
jgi:hypothetical protein